MKLEFNMYVHKYTGPNEGLVICLTSPHRHTSWVPGDITVANTRKPLNPIGCWAWLKYKKVG
ncbi:hypothetical protein LCGC14_1846360 [marine sediment metagenome]|uniref:Uncharacterized protein n=1 Tax=marine sediment metagenome TaxID=412755 RepID=A0A0F9GBQ1_9ZZZZ